MNPALSLIKGGKLAAPAILPSFSSTHFLNPSGTSVTAFTLSPVTGSPSRMRCVSASISSSVFMIDVAWQRQWGCHPVNLKSFGYFPFSWSQMSVNLCGLPSRPLQVWLPERCTSIPTTKSSCCHRSWSAVWYAVFYLIQTHSLYSYQPP
ncbi:MAG: hypothetical protein J5529_02600 [Prevotella sp.]|nr:hypothetical protein [Prevotella sp.]